MPYAISVAKSPLCGLEADLRLDRYVLTNAKTPKTETGFVFFEKTLESAIEEARSILMESRKWKQQWNVFAVRVSAHDCWEFQAYELMASVRKVKERES